MAAFEHAGCITKHYIGSCSVPTIAICNIILTMLSISTVTRLLIYLISSNGKTSNYVCLFCLLTFS